MRITLATLRRYTFLCLPAIALTCSTSRAQNLYALSTDVPGFKDEVSGESAWGPATSTFTYSNVATDPNQYRVIFEKLGPNPLSRSPLVHELHSSYTIAKTTLDTFRYLAIGLSTGILTVPFKFQTHGGNVTAGTTVGPYVGLNTDVFRKIGLQSAFVVSLGLAIVDVNDINAATTSTQSGVSGAGGLIFSISKFQLGVLAGVDHLGGSAGTAYVYNNKPWLSFALGYTFATAK